MTLIKGRANTISRAITVAALFSCACSKPADLSNLDFPRPNVRDSAGVHIVEYATLGPMPTREDAPARNPFVPQLRQYQPLLLETKPFLILGGTKSEDKQIDEFDSRGNPSVVELQSGSLVVSDFNRLMYFDRKGNVLHRAGREGRGPGEFRQITALCALLGDRVMTTDLEGRISIWDKDGVNLHTFPRPPRRLYSGCEEHGGIVTTLGNASADSVAAGAPVPYALTTPGGKAVKELGLHAADGRNGMPFFAFTAHTFYFGDGQQFTIEQFDSTAKLVSVSRLLRQREPLTEESWRAARDQAIPRNSSPEVAASIRNSPKPNIDRWQAFSYLRVDPFNRLWVSDYSSPGHWTIFDSTGVLVRRFDTPISIAGIGRNFVAVISRNADFAVSILFYRIIDGG